MEKAHSDTGVESTDPDGSLDIEVHHPDVRKATAAVTRTNELKILVDLGEWEPLPELDDGRDAPRPRDEEASEQESVSGVRLRERELIGSDDWLPKISEKMVKHVQVTLRPRVHIAEVQLVGSREQSGGELHFPIPRVLVAVETKHPTSEGLFVRVEDQFFVAVRRRKFTFENRRSLPA